MTAEEMRKDMAGQLPELRSTGRIRGGVVNGTVYGKRNGDVKGGRQAIGWGFLTESHIEDPLRFRDLLAEGGSVLRLFPDRSRARSGSSPYYNKVVIGRAAEVHLSL